MRRLVAMLALAAAMIPAGASAADPSASCNAGFVPPSTTPAGLGARVGSDPMTATVTVCLAGGPLPGHVKASAGVADPSATVAVDGDPSASMLGCSDGYTAARVNGDGVSLYQAPDGGFTSRARAKSPAEIADSAARHCTPASV